MKWTIVFPCILSGCATVSGPNDIETTYDVFYTTAKTERQSGDFYKPKPNNQDVTKKTATKWPVVIAIHGGGWTSRSKSDMSMIGKSLAANGFACFAINYRFAPEHKHPAPIEDLENAIEFLKSRAADWHLDLAAGVVLWGYSSGGHIAGYYAYSKTRPDSSVASPIAPPPVAINAVILGGAPTDFTWYPESPYISKYLGGYRDQLRAAYEEASPRYHLSAKSPPTFLYHARADDTVEIAQSRVMHYELSKLGVDTELYEVGFWGHITAFLFSTEANRRAIQFLQTRATFSN